MNRTGAEPLKDFRCVGLLIQNATFLLHHCSETWQLWSVPYLLYPSYLEPWNQSIEKTLCLDKPTDARRFRLKSEIFWPRIKIFWFGEAAHRPEVSSPPRWPTTLPTSHRRSTGLIPSHGSKWCAATAPTHRTPEKIEFGQGKTLLDAESWFSPTLLLVLL